METMPEPAGVSSLDDILRDERGSWLRAVSVERCCSDLGSPPRQFRDIRPTATVPTARPGATGSDLVQLRPASRRVRYQTLLHLENQHRVDLDFGYLIASASHILESELTDALTAPAQRIAPSLMQALHDAGKPKQAEVLEAWAAGRPPTIGIASLVLLALRYGATKGDEACAQFLTHHFRPGYAPLVAGGQMGRCLDRLRERFRNPACHGEASFGRDDYYEFSRLLVARRRFSEWIAEGPQFLSDLGAEGLLHRHLADSQLLVHAEPQGGDVPWLERLLDLARPRKSRLSIRVSPRRSGETGIAEEPNPGSPRLQKALCIGDFLSFHVRADEPCQVALIDIGTSGNPAVVLPNGWQTRAVVHPGQELCIPPPDDHRYRFELTPPPGRERVIALAWTRAPAFSLDPRPGDSFRLLTPDEVLQFCSAVEVLDATTWAACTCDFEVLRREH
jgi:hypothetical protein